MKENGEDETQEVQGAPEADGSAGTQPEMKEESAGMQEDAKGAALSPIREFTKNEGVEQRPNLSLREILGGDILANGWLKRQMGVILLCAFFSIIYITNRYASEQELIEIEKLKTDLKDIRYKALTRSSELTVKTRQSQVENILRHTSDSILEVPKEPPFLIKSK